MSRARDYIPSRDADFDGWFRNLVQYAVMMALGPQAAWTHIPAPLIAELEAAYVAWHEAYVPTLTPHTSVETRAKNDARAAAERLIRAFKRQFLDWPPVNDEDRVAMKLRLPDLVRTPHIEVKEEAEFLLRLRGIREILVDFWVKGTERRAKPEGYDGAVLIWGVLDAPPANQGELTGHAMATRTPHALKFGETQRGKTVYVAAAWQNARGNIGQWSEIQSAVIP